MEGCKRSVRDKREWDIRSRTSTARGEREERVAEQQTVVTRVNLGQRGMLVISKDDRWGWSRVGWGGVSEREMREVKNYRLFIDGR